MRKTVDSVLENILLDTFRYYLEVDSDKLYSRFIKSTGDVWGKEIIVVAPYVDRNGKPVTLKADLANLYGTITLPRKVLEKKPVERNLVMNLIEHQFEQLKSEFGEQIKDQLWNKDRVVKTYLPDGTCKIDEYSKKMIGITEIFDTASGIIYGRARQIIPQLNPVIETVDVFNVDTIKNAIAQMKQNGSEIDIIACSFDTWLKIAEGSYFELKFDDISVVLNELISDDEVYLLNTADFAIHQLCDWQWLKDEDGNILQGIEGHDYKATIVKYCNLICSNISNQCLLLRE